MADQINDWIRLLDEKKDDAIRTVYRHMINFYNTVDKSIYSLDTPGTWQPHAANPIAFLQDGITRAKVDYQDPLLAKLKAGFGTFSSQTSPAFARNGGGPRSLMAPPSVFNQPAPLYHPYVQHLPTFRGPVKTEVDIAEAKYVAWRDAAALARQQQQEGQAVVGVNQGASTSTGRRTGGRPTAARVRYAEETSDNDEQAQEIQHQARPRKRRRVASPAVVPVVTPAGRKKHPCTFEGCSKSFAYPNGLRKHILTHSGERPHACRICGLTFALTATRNRHLRTHTRENTHTCTWPDCAYAAIRSSSVVQHVRAVHFKLPASKTDQARQGIIDTRDASEYVEKI